MQDLKIAIIQTKQFWEDKEQNLAHFEQVHLRQLEPGSVDLILLPEMFHTGFSMQSAQLAESESGPAVTWLVKMAERLECQVGATFICRDSESIYNRFVIVSKAGIVARYDKRHLFRMAEEHLHYQPGKGRVIHQLKGWNILMQVCYDLRFPVFSRNSRTDDGLTYDLAIYLANWPERRSAVWSTLLRARAIENQAYCVGVNRVGLDGKNIHYSGDSALIDPWGNVVFEATKNEETVKILTLERSVLDANRSQFPAYLDADQ